VKARLPWIAIALLCLWVHRANVSPDFTPRSSELTNARGFARGVVNLVILPDDAPFRAAARWTSAAIGGLCLLLAVMKPHARWTHGRLRLLPIGGCGFLLAVALSPYLSAYRVVLAPRTFALGVALIFAARVAGRVPALSARWRPIASGTLAAAFFASAMFQTLGDYGSNYSGFIRLARDVASRSPYLEERPDLARSLVTYDAGYDGQFMYLMAFDPLLQRFQDRPQAYSAFIDSPPYRYGRIGFSAMIRLASLGRPEWYPVVMMWLILAAHLALGTLLARFAAHHGTPAFAALSYIAIPAFMSSLMSALPEALAAAGLVAGVFFWQLGRILPAAAAFGAALLVRETAVVVVAMCLLWSGWRGGEWKRSALLLAGALAPVCLWRLFVAGRFFPDFGWAALVTNPGDLGVPFSGLGELWLAGLRGTQPSPEVAGALVFPLILIAAILLGSAMWRARRGPLEAAALVYGLVAISLNYEKIWSHLPSGERGTFELFICLLLLLLGSAGRPAWIGRSLTAFFAGVAIYTFFIAPDAATSRAALLLIR
jgi:hypothetical protein